MAETRYLPYGEQRWTAGDAQPTDFTFTGQRAERGFGLMDYKARYYNPRLGRFISADSIVPEPGNPQAWNRYSYVLNRPLQGGDPTGHQGPVGDDLIEQKPLSSEQLAGLEELYNDSLWPEQIPGATFDDFVYGYQAYKYYTSNPDKAWEHSNLGGIPGNEADSLMWARLYSEYGRQDVFLPLDDEVVLAGLEQARLERNVWVFFAAVGALWFTSEYADVGGMGGPGFDPDQDALIQIAKDAKRRGGLTVDEAKVLGSWADEYNVPFRGPELHPDRNFKDPHIHVGPVDHIPVLGN